METKTLFEKVLKDNEIIKGQLNNLQTSIQILKNNMLESQNNKNNINFSSLLDDLNISSSKEENDKEQNKINNDNQNELLLSINPELKENKNINTNNDLNKKYIINKEPIIVKNITTKKNLDDNIHKRNIKKLLKEKEVINQIYLLKENFNNYNNYNIFNKSSQENTSKKNSAYLQGISNSNKKNKNKIIFNYYNQKNNSNKKVLIIKEDDVSNKNIKSIKNNRINNNKAIAINSAKKGKRTNSMININLNIKSNIKNRNKKNLNKFNHLRHSYDDYFHKNESYIEYKKNNKKNNNVDKRAEILNYLKEINNLQNIISQLKKENSLLKNSLEKEKQKNKKYRKITEEIINHFEKPNNKI